MIKANEISQSAKAATFQLFLKHSLIGEFHRLSQDQVELLFLALTQSYRIPARNNQRTRDEATQILATRKAQIKEKKEAQEKLAEKGRTFYLELVGLILVAFVGAIFCFQSKTYEISQGGRIQTVEPTGWSLGCGGFGFGIIVFACGLGYYRLM